MTSDAIHLDDDFFEHDLVAKFEQTNEDVVKHYTIKRMKFALKLEQRRELITAASRENPTHGLMIKTEMMTGLRVGELAEVLKSNIDFYANTISVSIHLDDDEIDDWQPKTATSVRTIPLESSLAREIQRYIDDQRVSMKTAVVSPYVFIGRAGQKFNQRSVINFINKYAKRCTTIGKTIGSHCLRRTFASFLIKNGVPIGSISTYLGHQSIKTTMRYLFEIRDLDDYEKTGKILSNMV